MGIRWTTLKNLFNMIDYLEFESVPYEEPCAQLLSNDKNPHFKKDNQIECLALINQLKRMFPNQLVQFRIGNNEHDAGSYKDVRIYFNDNDEESSEAYEIEANFPTEWDKEAIEELTLNKYSLFNKKS